MALLPSTFNNNLKVLRGIAMFAPKRSDGTYEAAIPLSPSAEFSVAIASETATYVSAESGVNETLDTTIISVDRTASLTCNNLSDRIKALFVIGTQSKVAQTSATITDEVLQYVAKDASLQLGVTPGTNNGVGAFNVSAVGGVESYEGATAVVWAGTTAKVVGDVVVPVVSNSRWYMCTTAGTTAGSAPTFPTNGGTVTDGSVVWQDMGLIAYTVNTDYEVDTQFGLIHVLSTGAIATAIDRVPASLGRTFRLRADYTRPAATIDQVATDTLTSKEGKFWFTEQNPKGSNSKWYAPSCSIAPDGDLALKSGSDYGAVGFTLTFQKPATGSAIYIDGVPA